jgi:hypothetical protein
VLSKRPTTVPFISLDPEVKYIQDLFLSLYTRLTTGGQPKALAEKWGDADKRRAAISFLYGKVLT